MLASFVSLQRSQFDRRDWIRWGVWILAAAPLVRFFMFDAPQGLDHLLCAYLSDDAFYAFEVARHIPEFNEGIPTTGFHPLYIFLIAPLHRWLSPEVAILSSMAGLAASISVGTLVAFRLVTRLWGSGVGLWCAAAWATNGTLYATALRGLEAIIAAVLVLTFYLIYVDTDFNRVERRRLLLLGAVAGIAFWARMDSPVVFAPVWLHVAWSLRRRVRLLAAFVGPSVAIPLLWFGMAGIMAGHLFPDSSAALRHMRGLDGRLAPWPMAEHAMLVLGRALDRFVRADLSKIHPWYIIGPLLAAAAGITVWLARVEKDGRSHARLSLLVAGGLALWGSYYVFYLGDFRPWYFAHAAPFLVVVVAAPLARAAARLVRDPAVAGGLWSATILALIWQTLPAGPNAPQEYDKYHAALAADHLLDGMGFTGGIGAFNTGIYDYVMSRDVLNLDGVVNPEAREALQTNSLPAYLERKGVTVLIEHGSDANLHRLRQDRRVVLERWINLSKLYRPFRGRPKTPTFLWRIHHRGG